MSRRFLDGAEVLHEPAKWATRRHNMGCVTEVHFWLDDSEHECCGDQRKVGDTVRVPLWFEDVPVQTDDPPGLESLWDGSMIVVGDVINRRQSQPFLLVDAGVLTVACRRRFAGKRLHCEGRLWEERHEPVVPTVKGTITGALANVVVAFLPGRTAARTPTALLLRAE